MKKLLPFLARLVVISLLFVPALPLLHQSYRFILALGTTAALPTREIMAALPYDASGNLYTFLVLILATPGLTVRKRIIGAATGAVTFLCADSFMTAIWLPYLQTPQLSLANMAVSYGWTVVAHFLLPFLLWLAFSFREIERLFKGETIHKTPNR